MYIDPNDVFPEERYTKEERPPLAVFTGEPRRCLHVYS
jgi:hypothetical protein